jgi:uncharacterized membrane protein YhaH (DUF805 family)
MNWYLAVLRKYAVFNGRSRRLEYWIFLLVNMVIVCALTAVEAMMGVAVGSPQSALTILYGLFVFIPELAVSVRRLHDTGRTGWWLLIGLIPFVGWIVLLVFSFQDSQPGENRFGPNPKSA